MGRDVGVEVSKSYKSPFKFTGNLKKVIIDIDGDGEVDAQTEFDRAMRQQ